MRSVLKLFLHAGLACMLVLGLSAGMAPVAVAEEGSTESTPTLSLETSASVSTTESAESTPTGVCRIGAASYDTLQDALDAAPEATPTTITLLQDISVTEGLAIDNKIITFDLAGFNLAVSSAVGDGLALWDSVIDYRGPGSFTVASTAGNALYIYGGSCMLTGASVGAGGWFALDCDGAAFVTVNGSVAAAEDAAGAIRAMGGSQVTINGAIAAPVFIVFMDAEGVFAELTADDFMVPTTQPGYRTYSDGVSAVWVQYFGADTGVVVGVAGANNNSGSESGSGAEDTQSLPIGSVPDASILVKAGDMDSVEVALLPAGIAVIALAVVMALTRRERRA
ncbi:MAG: hypothetical protein FWC54_00665 [Actinomycetia bacterium]|nr:hypothetical protein [Actinomycetes bacterium]